MFIYFHPSWVRVKIWQYLLFGSRSCWMPPSVHISQDSVHIVIRSSLMFFLNHPWPKVELYFCPWHFNNVMGILHKNLDDRRIVVQDWQHEQNFGRKKLLIKFMFFLFDAILFRRYYINKNWKEVFPSQLCFRGKMVSKSCNQVIHKYFSNKLKL